MPDAQRAGGAHQQSEGLVLAAQTGETAHTGPDCPARGPVRRYDIAAIAVDITLNRYLDHDPDGRMFALTDDVARIRAEEAANAAARAGKGAAAVSPGLQEDAIQPLALRVRPGECLELSLTNRLGNEPASIHVHDAALLTSDRRPAVVANRKAMAAPGQAVRYRWWVPPSEPEGTHYFHSHGIERQQSAHGLFGTIVVEPRGATWTAPETGRPLRTGWSADVVSPGQPPFREYVIDYHEVGDETYRIIDAKGAFVPQVDPLLGAYRPGTRALNYRSEPFMDRLLRQQSEIARFDESLSYSSYTFGDPATPIARAYLGDRVKQRVVHGGGEVFHVHHVHGGSIRWQRLANLNGVATRQGLVKHPSLLPKGSERVDSQALGPSESFDTENECGAGGCQQSPGDFLFHCHVAHHYFAGMWGIWRVYNTLQDGSASTDGLPPLMALREAPPAAVTSDRLTGPGADAAAVEAQLPPPGVPVGYDASVWNWTVEGGRNVGEPDDGRDWPGRDPTASGGVRRPILFDPRSGRLAYPLLRPHLGARPPFAPNHGPAPFLDPTANGRPPPAPGASGPASLCPEGTTLRPVDVDALPVAVPRNARQRVVDGQGELYVLAADRATVLSDPTRRVPLAIRANAGKDCMDVLFRSELEDNAINHGFAKVSLHIHMVQFDVQASDGIDTGFNYEQSVRPFTVEGERLTAAVPAGSVRVPVTGVGRFRPGAVVALGLERTAGVDIRRIASVANGALMLESPVESLHAAGETVSTEFLRHRWYPDVQFGTAYFHDHVNALQAWTHGLFGALISEPPDATWHDPHTGAVITSGAIADIHTNEPVSRDVHGSFREFVAFLQDNDPINRVGRSSGSALNLRAEPLEGRARDPARQFSSDVADPVTPVVEAYVGDPVVFRTLVAATNDVHEWHVDGHAFRTDPFNARAPLAQTMHVGISERFDLTVPAAGGPRRRAGDYLSADARSFKLQEGSWGLLRVLDPASPSTLLPLPGAHAVSAATGDICPSGAPVRHFAVDAIDVDLPMLDGPGRAFVLTTVPRVRPQAPTPLVLHVGVGDCLDVTLTNHTAEGPVSIHPMGLVYDPAASGLAVGREQGTMAARGASARYRFYADPANGESVALLLDGADLVGATRAGLYGAVVIGPRGARSSDPVNGRPTDRASAWSVDVRPKDGRPYRDVTLFLQDDDAGIGTHRMPYTKAVDGVVAINYQRAPFDGPRPLDAPTPLIQAEVGDPVRLHVVVPTSEQSQVFSIEGHDWPTVTGTGRASSVQIGAWEAVTLDVTAGGSARSAGEYEYGTHREPYREAGMWGRMIVACPGDTALRSLAEETPCGGARGSWSGPVLAFVAAIGLMVMAIFTRRANRRPVSRTT
jgi:FtsP/CotA-like multicopper oxidase with cupredoxin domain